MHHLLIQGELMRAVDRFLPARCDSNTNGTFAPLCYVATIVLEKRHRIAAGSPLLTE